MMSFETVIRLVGDVEAGELRRWIEERWVLPSGDAGGYAFEEVDVARIRLIAELRRELAVDEQAMPIVLHLLDQIYALRRRLKALCGALEGQPPEIRDAVLARLDAADRG
jgi:chaperone modulatory protein CbpM